MEFLNTLLNDPVIVSLSKTLLHFCWQGALIAGVLYLFLNTVDKKHAELRYLGAIGAMVLFLIAPLYTFGHYYSVEVINGPSLPVTSVFLQEALVNINELEFETFLPLAALLWLAGVLTLSFQLSVEMFQVYQLPKKQAYPVEEHVQQLFDSIAKRLKIKQTVRLLASEKAEVPMVIGVVRPVVLVPVSMLSGLSVTQLEMLFAHELGHIKRHDFLVNLLQTLVEVLFFYHPAVKWVSRQVRIEREYCCDDIAVKCCGNAHDYARTLADAESIRKASIPELAMAATGGDLKGRVVRMVQQSDCSDNFSHSWHSLALAGVIAVGFATLSFYAQDGLKSRFADTLGHTLPKNNLIPEPEPSARVEVAMNPSSANDALYGVQAEDPGLDVLGANALGVNASGVDDGTAISVTSDETVTTTIVASTTASDTLNAPSDSGLVATDVSTVVVAQAVPQQTLQQDVLLESTVESGADDMAVSAPESQNVSIVASVQNEQAFSAADDVVLAEDTQVDELILADANFEALEQLVAPGGVPEATPDIQIEGFNPSSSALKVSLAKLNEKLQSEGFAFSIESDRIAMATEPETIDAPTIVAPRLIASAPPRYPRMAVSKGIEAEVIVSFTVNNRGRVEDLNFENKVQGYFKRSVRQALKDWRFEPGSIDGETAKMSMQKVFTFSDPDNYAQNAGAKRFTGSRIKKDI